jgi:hypothetical protein
MNELSEYPTVFGEIDHPLGIHQRNQLLSTFDLFQLETVGYNVR